MQERSNAMKNDQQIWTSLVEAFESYLKAEKEFFSSDVNRVQILKSALRGRDRLTALHLLRYINSQELLQLFDELVFLASFAHGGVKIVREIIESLPRSWVLENIETAAEPYLQNGSDDQYRRFLELYIGLDKEFARKLALRAKQSSDFDIREAGDDFLQKLD